MEPKIFKIHGGDHTDIFIHKWVPEGNSKGVFMIIHGAVEHAGRYSEFANFLTKNGYTVYAPDQRGHGMTAKATNSFSYFAENHGWKYLLDDLRRLHKYVKAEHQGLPIFLFGQSMGSFIVRDYIGNCSGEFEGVILAGGTIGKPGLARILGMLASFLQKIYGQKAESKLIHNLLFGKLNREIKGYETPADFLSTDKEEVRKYLEDDFCNRTVTYNYAVEFAAGSLECNRDHTYQNTPDNLPILVISGLEDPVGGKKSVEVLQLAEAYQKNNTKNVTVKLYEDARHELLHEKIKGKVMEDILEWVSQ